MKTWLKGGLIGIGIVIVLELILLIIGVILNIFIDGAFLFLNLPFLLVIQFIAVKIFNSAVMWHSTGIVGTQYNIGMIISSSLLFLLIIFIIGTIIGLIVQKVRKK